MQAETEAAAYLRRLETAVADFDGRRTPGTPLSLRTLTGLIAEQSPQAVTLLDARAERTIVPRDRIDTITVSPVSLMPEKLLDALTDQQVRDLFAYLAADVAPPPPAPPGGKKFTVCLVSGSGEYQSNESLAAFQS